MTGSLFRKQAIQHQNDRLYGEVVIARSIPLYTTSYGILLIVMLALIFLAFGTYTRRETVVGYIVPDGGLVKVYASTAGVLKRISIREGDLVQAGDLLFTVATHHASEVPADRDLMLLAELEDQKQNMLLRITQEQQLKLSGIAALNGEIKGAEEEVIKVNESLKTHEQQTGASRKISDKYYKLYSAGHVSEIAYQEYRQAYLSAKSRLLEYQARKVKLDNQLTRLRQDLQEFPLQWESRQLDLRQRLSDIEQRIVEITGRREYSVRAPIAGRLAALQVAPGQALDARALIAAILPENSAMHAELFLPTRAAGFVSTGRPVYLRYAAFPYQHYGVHKGTISSIAQVILAPKELPIPVALNEPVYRVKAVLESHSVEVNGKKFPLQAGMLLDADIVLEERTLFEWLFEPVIGLKQRI